jgi:hypothetical protein
MTCQLSFSIIIRFPFYLVTLLPCPSHPSAMNSTSWDATSAVEDFSLTFPVPKGLDLDAVLAWWNVGISFVFYCIASDVLIGEASQVSSALCISHRERSFDVGLPTATHSCSLAQPWSNGMVC